MAARKIHTTLRDDWKAKIQASMIVRGFMRHFEGKQPLTASQIKVGEILLRKVVPDLARQELTSPENGPAELIVKWKDAK